MIQFQCDYTEGAHESILKRLTETNYEQTIGYGCDDYCEEARNTIRRVFGVPDASVHFLVGGTQANATVIAAALKPYQGVICASTGHIFVHETGAIEATSHKVLATPTSMGKITAAQVSHYCRAHYANSDREHEVQPGMVYISLPTELGTLYTTAELEALYQVCEEFHMYLFVDGARLGYGLMASDCDITPEFLAAHCDVFYAGGTKMGALFGEAVVITNKTLNQDFRYMIKRHGGMLAKGRLLGIQFQTLFEDGLYWKLGKHADQLAEQIRNTLQECGFSFLARSHTNQVFPILPDDLCEKLSRKYMYCYQERIDNSHSAIRFCTSWATRPENVDALCQDIRSLSAK